jgi:GTP pyrophosphokinase
VGGGRVPVDGADHPIAASPVDSAGLSASERELLGDLFAIVEEHAAESPLEIDRTQVERAFVYACEHHADQRRKSGEEFIIHPVGVAKICAGMRLDTETLVAALLHDTVEDTSASLEDVQEKFGEEIAGLVDGVTKLTGLTFSSRDEAQAENYRKMMVAMASDIRVILIKLADRLHNMRTIEAMSKQKQIEKAKETLDIYAPIAHRLGIHAIKWELEDLAFATLHPRKYNEIKGLVNQQRAERERYVNEAGAFVSRELDALGIAAEINGRAKHFYSIYSKMTRKGREFNEIYDLTAMRVIVDSVKDCYGAVGVIHSLWKPLPGRFKDFVAMPKFNMYQSLHTTVIGPEGRPLEIQIRTREMHDMAEFGIAAHWIYKQDPTSNEGDGKLKWLRRLLDWQQEMSDPKEFMDTLKVDLFEDEVFVFTPKGEVKSLAAGATPLDFAYEVHTDVGHRCVGAKVNGKIVPLSYELRSGDIVEVLTSKRERGPSRDWLALVKTTRARNKI